MENKVTRAKISGARAAVGGLIACLAWPGGWASAGIAVNEYDTQSQGQLSVYYPGTNAGLYAIETTVSSQNRTTKSWLQLAGVGGKPPMAAGSGIASYNNTIWNAPEVFYLTNVNNAVHVEQLWGTTASASDLTAFTGAMAAAAGSSVVGYIDSCAQSDNVFYVGSDQHVHLLRWSPSTGWQTADLTRLSGSVPAAGTALAGHEMAQSEEIFFLGSDQHVHELWQWSGCTGGPLPDGWHSTDVNQASRNGAPNALSGSALTGFFDGEGSQWLDAVFYVDVNHNLQEIYFSNTLAPIGSWENVNLTLMSGAPAVAGNSLASVIVPRLGAAPEAVFFIDARSNVWQLSGVPLFVGNDLSWSATNITLAAGAPAATTSSPLAAADSGILVGCYFDGTNICELGDLQELVYYVDAGGDIHSLGYVPNISRWTTADITRGVAAPKY